MRQCGTGVACLDVMAELQTQSPRLVRVMGFWMLTAYGVGDILGAGIYALVGKVAGVAGSLSWLSFLVAGTVAGLSGLSYAELGSRFPYSGGEAYFVQQALGRPKLSFLTGWLVFCSGVVSMATIARAFAGYATHLVPEIPESLAVVMLVSLLAAITFVGIRISSTANAVCTIIEATGLLLVVGSALVWLCGDSGVDELATRETLTSVAGANVVGPGFVSVLQGAALAFFAFIGFEDMVNVAEEVRDPKRTLPRALLTALVASSMIYVLVVLVATTVIPASLLAESDAPLLTVMETSWPQFPLVVFSIIALFAVANTGLANFVTASRLVFGMSEQNLLPRWLGWINPKTHTPDYAIAACFVVGLLLALSGSLSQLAGATSFLILVIFSLMNVSLILIRRRDGDSNGFRAPSATPYVALACCMALLRFVSREAATTALVIIAVGALFACGQKRTSESAGAES